MRIGNTYDSGMSISKQKWETEVGILLKVKVIIFSFFVCSLLPSDKNKKYHKTFDQFIH